MRKPGPLEVAHRPQGAGVLYYILSMKNATVRERASAALSSS